MMATLTVNKSGNTAGYNIQWYEGKVRITIYLGGRKYNRKTAERLKEIVERLQYYRRNGIIIPDRETEHWLQSAPAEIKAKLSKVGLIAVTESKTCQQLWDAYMKHKTDIKPKTVKAYNECRNHFFKMFSTTESIEKITPERLLEWKSSLLDEYAKASVAGYIKNLGAVLKWAVDKQKWLTDNPLANIERGSFVNEEGNQTISMDEYYQLLDACPNQEWRTIIALARIGGLRCPSELQQLRWSDINWEKNRFLVRSPKTEHHENHRERIVPLFAELRTELDRHFLLDETIGNEFVIQSLQGTNWGLHTPFQKIAYNAGLGTIIRPFDNMRASRSHEVFERFGAPKENEWIGHSEAIRKKHYKGQFSDEAFAEAADVDLVGKIFHAKSHAKIG